MELNEAVFRDKLRTLNSSSASIEGTSTWVCYHRAHAQRVAVVWEEVFSKADQPKRLALVYLASDIIQNSRRKGPEFASEFLKVAPRALRHMLARADAATAGRVRRVIGVWRDRKVFGSAAGRALDELLDDAAGSGAPGAGGPGTAVPGAPHGAPGPGDYHNPPAPGDNDGRSDSPAPVAPEDLLRLLQAAQAARHESAASAASLARVPLQAARSTLDPGAVAAAHAALTAALGSARAEAEAAHAAAGAAGAAAQRLLRQEAGARGAAEKLGEQLAELERATSSPPSPDASPAAAARPGGGPGATSEGPNTTAATREEAAALAAALANRDPSELLELVRGLGAEQQAQLVAAQRGGVQPAQPAHVPTAAAAEEYDPDDPF
ncbi:hypothetical protein ACKKBF_B03975 [Auxenochlorella protothecoides x Auxenochlorella symbiontica]